MIMSNKEASENRTDNNITNSENGQGPFLVTQEEIDFLDRELETCAIIDCACKKSWCRGECESIHPVQALNNMAQEYELGWTIHISRVSEACSRAVWRIVMWLSSVTAITQVVCFSTTQKTAKKEASRVLLEELRRFGLRNLTRPPSRRLVERTENLSNEPINDKVGAHVLITDNLPDKLPLKYFDGINLSGKNIPGKYSYIKVPTRANPEMADQEKDSPEALKHQDAGGPDQTTVDQSAQSAITTQRDESAHEVPVVSKDSGMKHLQFYNDVPQTVPNIVGKWYLYDSFLWNTSQGIGTIIFQGDLLDSFTSIATGTLGLTTLMEQYQYIVPQMKVKVQLAVAPMMSGCLIVGYRYFGDANAAMLSTNSQVLDAWQVANMPNGKINAQAGNEIVLDIPFRGPVDAIPTNSTFSCRGLNYCQIYVGVYSPLKSASECNEVAGVVYVSFSSSEGHTQFYGLRKREKSEHEAPRLTLAPSATLFDASKPNVNVDLQIDTPNDGIAMIKAYRKRVTAKPEVVDQEDLGALLSQGLKVISNLDRPTVSSDVGSTQVVSTPNLSLGKGPIHLKQLRLDNKVITPHCKNCLGSEDEFNFGKLLSIYTPFAFGTVTTGMEHGSLISMVSLDQTTIQTIPVCPTLWYQLPTDAGASTRNKVNLVLEGPLAVMGHHFAYWSGSLKFKFEFFTAFSQACRIRVYYAPNRSDTTQTSIIADIDGAYGSVVFDLKEQTTFEFVAPYIWHAKQAPVYGPFRNKMGAVVGSYHHQRGIYNGTTYHVAIGNLYVMIESQLACTNAASKTFDFVVSVAAGDDFAYDVPVDSNYCPIVSSSFTKQNKEEFRKRVKPAKPEGDDVLNQGDSPVKNKISERSMDKMRISIFGNKSVPNKYHRGENPTLKDFARRFAVYHRDNKIFESSTEAANTWSYPVYCGPARILDKMPFDFISTLFLGYRFFKGGMRYAVQATDSSRNSTVVVQHIPEFASASLASVSINDSDYNVPVNFVTQWTMTPVEIGYATNFHPGLATEVANNTNFFTCVEAPFTSNYNCLLNNHSNGSIFGSQDPQYRYRQNGVVSSGSLTIDVIPAVEPSASKPCVVTLTVLRAMADDGHFYCFQGFPLSSRFPSDSHVIDNYGNSMPDSYIEPGDSRIYFRKPGDVKNWLNSLDKNHWAYQEAMKMVDAKFGTNAALEDLKEKDAKDIATGNIKGGTLIRRDRETGEDNVVIDRETGEPVPVFPSKANRSVPVLSAVAEVDPDEPSLAQHLAMAVVNAMKNLLIDLFGLGPVVAWFQDKTECIMLNVIQFLVADTTISKLSCLVRLFYDVGLLTLSAKSQALALLIAIAAHCLRGPKVYLAQAGDEDIVDLGVKWANFICPIVLGFFLEDEKVAKLSLPSRLAHYFKNVLLTGGTMYLFLTRNISFIKELVHWALGTLSPDYLQLVCLRANSGEVRLWCKKVAEITEANKREHVMNSSELQDYVRRLKEQGDTIISETRGLTPEIRQPFLNLYNKIVDLYNTVCCTIKFNNQFIEPVIIWLAGVPGCGKSTLMDKVAVNALEALGEVFEGNAVFTRNYNDFWNGYNNNPCVKYDDITFNESDQNIDRLLNEIQCLASVAPFNAPMAAIDDKHMIVNPKIVMIGGNKTHINNAAIGNARAFHRRRDILAWVDYSPRFRAWYTAKYGRWQQPKTIADCCDTQEELALWSEENGYPHLAFYIHENTVDPIPQNRRTEGDALSFRQFLQVSATRVRTLMRNRRLLSEKILKINRDLTVSAWRERGRDGLGPLEQEEHQQQLDELRGLLRAEPEVYDLITSTTLAVRGVVSHVSPAWRTTAALTTYFLGNVWWGSITTNRAINVGRGEAFEEDHTRLGAAGDYARAILYVSFGDSGTRLYNTLEKAAMQAAHDLVNTIHDICHTRFNFRQRPFLSGAHPRDLRSDIIYMPDVRPPMEIVHQGRWNSANSPIVLEEDFMFLVLNREAACVGITSWHGCVPEGVHHEQRFCIHRLVTNFIRYMWVEDAQEYRLVLTFYVNTYGQVVNIALKNDSLCCPMEDDNDKIFYLRNVHNYPGLNVEALRTIRREGLFAEAVLQTTDVTSAERVLTMLENGGSIAAWLKVIAGSALESTKGFLKNYGHLILGVLVSAGLWKGISYLVRKLNPDLPLPEGGIVGSGDAKTPHGKYERRVVKTPKFTTRAQPQLHGQNGLTTLAMAYDNHCFTIDCLRYRLRGIGLKAGFAIIPQHFFYYVEERAKEFDKIALTPEEYKHIWFTRIVPDNIKKPGTYKITDGTLTSWISVVNKAPQDEQPILKIEYHSANTNDYPVIVEMWKAGHKLRFVIPRKQIVVEDFEDKDVSLIQFPNTIPLFKDFRGNTARDSAVADSTNLALFEIDDAGTLSTVLFKHCVDVDEEVQYDDSRGRKSKVYTVRGYSYPYHHVGLCGSPLIDVSTQKILGFHICTAEDRGISTRIPFEAVFAHIDSKNPIVQAEDSAIVKSAEAETLDYEQPGEYVPIGEVGSKLAVTIPIFSNIRRSPLHSRFKTTRRPVSFRTLGERWPGEIVCKEMITKGFGVPVALPTEMLSSVFMAMVDKYCSMPPKFPVKSCYTLEEAVVGVPEIPEFTPMKLNTSCGWPLNALSPGKNKGDFISISETRQVEFKEELLDIYNRDHELRIKGVVPDSYYTEFPKDERLKPGKKPRLISGSPLQTTLEFKRYFGAFVSYITSYRTYIKNQVGINPWGLHWHEMITSMKKKGTKFVCGDYKDFGPKLHPAYVNMFLMCAQTWYYKFCPDHDPEDDVVRATLIQELISCRRILGNFVYQTLQGSPSGSWITEIINSFVNDCEMCYAWEFTFLFEDHLRGFWNMNHHTEFNTYGDDILGVVDDEVVDRFNNTHIQNALRAVDMVYTDANKVEPIRPFVELEDTTFLKYSTRKHPTRKEIWQAVMEEYVIEELPAWVRKSSDIVAACEQNLEAALRFAYTQGPDFYEAFRERVKESLCWLGRPATETPPWSHYDHSIYDLGLDLSVVGQ
nr:MAG: polyprotein [Hubei picorna-like virus 44]